jgi:hypothetical protein
MNNVPVALTPIELRNLLAVDLTDLLYQAEC